MSPEADERAKGVDLPEWWLEKVRELVDERKDSLGENLSQLGRSLADAVGREEPWDHSSVSRFLRNRNTTVPMAAAFSELLGIPRPFFVPRSFDEALALTATAKRYEGKKAPTREQAHRLAAVDELLDEEKRQAELERSDRAADKDRSHGKNGSSGGDRRAPGRRRPPASS